MNPMITLKSWVHSDHAVQEHRMVEQLKKLVHDPVFWVVVAFVAMMVVLIVLAINSPKDFNQTVLPQRMYPMY